MTWKTVETKTTSNLNVLTHNDREIGMICRPNNTRTDKNAWRCFRGIGSSATFIGHSFNKKIAKKMVESSYFVK